LAENAARIFQTIKLRRHHPNTQKTEALPFPVMPFSWLVSYALWSIKAVITLSVIVSQCIVLDIPDFIAYFQHYKKASSCRFCGVGGV